MLVSRAIKALSRTVHVACWITRRSHFVPGSCGFKLEKISDLQDSKTEYSLRKINKSLQKIKIKGFW